MSVNTQFVEKWSRYLNNVDREMACIAARKLGETKDPAVVPLLMEAIKNRPDDVRVAIIRALGTIQDPKALKVLLPLLKDNSDLVATAAAVAVGDIRSARAINALTDVIREYKRAHNSYSRLHNTDRGLYIAALHALRSIGTREALNVVELYSK